MAQFSIKEAVRYSFSAYGRHLVLLLSAAALMAASFWLAKSAPRFVAKRIGVGIVMEDWAVGTESSDAQAAPSEVALRKVQEVTARVSAHLQATPKHLLLIVFLVWLLGWGLYFTVALGCMKLGLSIKDRNSGSLNQIFQVSLRQVLRFLGGSVLFILYLICGFIGIAVLTIPFGMLCRAFLGDMLGTALPLVVWIGLFLGLFFWIFGYIFYGYCIVDKPTIGVRDALRMSRDATRGVRGRILLAALAFGLVAIAFSFIINKIVLMGGSTDMSMRFGENDLAVFLCGLVTTPFSIPYFTYIYRSLGSKGGK